MLKKILLGLIIYSGSVLSASGQEISVDEIIAKNMEARGGAANWKAVKTIIARGSYINFSDEEPFTIWRKRENRYRFDSRRLNKDVVHVFDGKDAWWRNPLFGPKFEKAGLIPADGNLAKTTLREKDFDVVYWDYQKKGHEVAFAGKQDVDGTPCYALKVTLQDSSIEHWFIDASSFLELKMTGETYDFGRKTSLETFFSDYREIEGVKMPFLIEQEYGIRYRTFEIESIKLNVDIADSLFVLPTEKQD